ncbi:MAG: helix-turn-helix domain-containing protein [archaeon]
MSEKYILASLDEKKSKDIANIISNETSRKILDYLGDHDKVAPVELSKKLSIPISTITYNLKQLKEQGLIEVKDFAWSDKGKKVELYSIAKKLIIIAPKGFDWKNTIKKIIPIALVGAIGTYLIKIFTPVTQLAGQKVMLAEESAVDMALAPVAGAAEPIAQAAFPYWTIFLAITCIIILIIAILDYRRSKK